MSNNFKIVLTIRFFGYLIFLTGFLGLFFMLGPLFTAEISFRVDRILGVKREIAKLTSSKSHQVIEENEAASKSGQAGSFANLKAFENVIIPASTEYGIVIEKINANAKIIPDIDPSNDKEYVSALTKGVAEAKGSTPPGKPGNLYLFSHSTDAPWNIVRFNAIFYLLKELDKGDKVIIFYKNKRYDYIVFDKVVVDSKDVSFLTAVYNDPVLTLQTCDPPGTLFNRLVVRAKLIGG